jgi:hypothetical protein
MTVFYSLESRSLSTGLAQRTIKNLEFMRRAHENGENVHIVTQVVNSLLCLLVFPQQKEKDFFEAFESVTLRSPLDLGAAHDTVPGFPDLTSLRVRQFECCEHLSDFFRHLRNAISHRRIEFSSDSHDLHEVMLRLTDGRSCTNWDIDLSAHDLLTLCMYISDEIVRQIL